MARIEVRLSELLGRHRLKQRQLADAAGIRPAAVNALYHSDRQRLELSQLVAVLVGLERLTGVRYGIADLLVYVPDQVPGAATDQGAGE